MGVGTKKRKARSDPGRAKQGPSKRRDVLLRRARGFMRDLSETDLKAAIPVLERYAQCPDGVPAEPAIGPGHPRIAFEDFAEWMATIRLLIDWTDVQEPCASDLAIFVANKGTVTEKAEALIAMIPIATRVFERGGEQEEKYRAESAETDAKESK